MCIRDSFHILAKHTGQTSQQIEEDFDRDRWMTALEAKDYGLVDDVMGDTSDVIKSLEDSKFQR